MIRRPVVAGRFYEGSKTGLQREVASFCKEEEVKEKVIGLIAPHAGFVYSGKVAGEVYSKVEIPEKVVILGPNHTGQGESAAMMSEGSWQTPLGEVEIDSGLARAILKNSDRIREDCLAHAGEHSIEVQLPFLQYLKDFFKFVPICIGYSDFEAYKEIGRAIASGIKQSGEDVLIVASSDMTHYESQSEAERKDAIAISAILKLDEEELFDKIRELNITMCGYAPTIAMMVAAKELGAKGARLIKYMTSGETSGDYTQVVGYAGIYCW